MREGKTYTEQDERDDDVPEQLHMRAEHGALDSVTTVSFVIKPVVGAFPLTREFHEEGWTRRCSLANALGPRIEDESGGLGSM